MIFCSWSTQPRWFHIEPFQLRKFEADLYAGTYEFVGAWDFFSWPHR